MKRSTYWNYALSCCCLLTLLLTGCAGKKEAEASPTPAIESATPHVVMIAATPEPTPTPTPEPTPEPVDHLGQRVRDNLMTGIETLQLVSFAGSIDLYTEADESSDSTVLVNRTTDRAISDLIVLKEVTSTEGKLFYQVKAAFTDASGYVLARDTRDSRLALSGISGYAMMIIPGCSMMKSPNEESAVLAQESYHVARILGMYKDFYYVITEDGNCGFVKPDQLKLIDNATLEAYLSSGVTPQAKEPFDIENLITYAKSQTVVISTESLIYDGLSQIGIYFNPGYYQFFQKDLSDLVQYPIGYREDVYNSSLFKLWNSCGNLAYYEDHPTQWLHVARGAALKRGDLLFFAEYGPNDTAEVETYEVVLRGPDSGYITACGIYLGDDSMLWVKNGQVETVTQLSASPIWKYLDSARRIQPEVTNDKIFLIESMISSAYDRLGTPYNNFCRMGEASYDCSGLIGWSLRRAGATQIRNGGKQFRETTASGLAHLEMLYYKGTKYELKYVSKSSGDATSLPQLERGDLVFLIGETQARISHVMIYLGDMRVIHSTTVTDFYRGTLVAGFRPELQGLYANALRIIVPED
ncbi:MAG: NlpC/P60 family protein [Christensenella sp.]|nr:NlpC/P60 family protein [Christensenella sp.]